MPRPRILFLTHRVPHPPNRGDRIRTYNVLRDIAGYADVSLACLADEPVSDETYAELNRLCVQVGIIPIDRYQRWVRAGLSMLSGRTISEGAFASAPLRQLLTEWGTRQSFDITLSSSSTLAQYQHLPVFNNARPYVDLIDVDSEKWFDYSRGSSGPKAWLYGLEGRRMRRLEIALAKWARRLFVVSEAEAELFRGFCPDGPIEAVPNGVDVHYFQPSSPFEVATAETLQSGNDGCVFVGALDYKPNIDGAIWFCRHVWPGIRAAHPQAVFRLVGREPVPEVRALSAVDGVEVIGTVPDVRPWLRRAAVVVAPLQIARGVQNKVLEAMAMGKAIVASPPPLVGLQARHGIHLLQAGTPDEWIHNVCGLLNDPAYRSELGLAALACVNSRYRWEQCLSALSSLLLTDDAPAEQTSLRRSVMEAGA